MSGTLRCQIPVADTVRPFLKVRGSGNKWHGGQGTSGARGRRRRRRGKKSKEIPEDVAMEVEESTKPGDTVISEAEEGLVFALAKVEAFEFNSEKLLMFSAIGYALSRYIMFLNRKIT